MSFLNATIITAAAFVVLSAIGALSTASAGYVGYGYQSQNSNETDSTAWSVRSTRPRMRAFRGSF